MQVKAGLHMLERVGTRVSIYSRLHSCASSIRFTSSSIRPSCRNATALPLSSQFVRGRQNIQTSLFTHRGSFGAFLQYKCQRSLFVCSTKFYSSVANDADLGILASRDNHRKKNVETRKSLVIGEQKLKGLSRGIFSGLQMSTSEKIAEAVKPQLRNVPKDLSPLLTKRVVRRKKTASVPRDKEYFDITAYASADEYNMESLKEAININSMFTSHQLPEDELDALHVTSRNEQLTGEPKEIFLFKEGTIVFWNVTKHEQQSLLEFVKPHQNGSYDDALLLEEGVENIEFTYTENKTSLVGNEIHLHRPEEDTDEDAVNRQLEMFTFSNAVALSVKLSIWEASLSNYVESVEWVLEDLKDGKRIRMSEAEVLKKAGELFTLSHLINLSSDLLDTPDFYWDRDNLEKLYHKTCNHLSLARRVKVMNEKLGQCVELTELLRDHLKDKHHTRLELMIIFLIFIEVIFGIDHLVERHSERRVTVERDTRSTE